MKNMKITPDSEFMQHERGKQGYLKKCISFCSGQDHAVSRELLVWICHKNLWITHVNQSFSCIAQWLQEDLSKWAFLGKTEMNPCSKNWEQYLAIGLSARTKISHCRCNWASHDVHHQQHSCCCALLSKHRICSVQIANQQFHGSRSRSLLCVCYVM